MMMNVGRALFTPRAAASRRLMPRALCTKAASPVSLSDDTEIPAIKHLTLSSPSNLNAMTVSMGNAVEEAVASLRSLPPADLKAVVLTGEGRAFSAGGDLAFLEARKVDSPTNNAEVMRAFYGRFISCLRTLPVLASSLRAVALEKSHCCESQQ